MVKKAALSNREEIAGGASAPAPGSERTVAQRLIPPLRVVIGCVTFDTVKVVRPVEHLRGEKVYLLHWDSGSTAGKKTVYGEFYDEVVRQLLEMGLRDGDIIEKQVRVSRFKDLMSELTSIMTKERGEGNDVYINVSAGSNEYVAAATVTAMMFDGVKPFTVHSREYTISDEKTIREVYSVDGKLVGLTKSVTEPSVLPTFQINMPPRDLVLALRVLRKRMDERKPTKYTQMIRELIQAGAWTYEPEDGRTRSVETDEITQKMKMYYSRHYIDGWIKHGWVDGKEGRGRALRITLSGINVTDIFYLE